MQTETRTKRATELFSGHHILLETTTMLMSYHYFSHIIFFFPGLIGMSGYLVLIQIQQPRFLKRLH